MSDAIMLNVNRWIYERGNYQIIIENAWNITAWNVYSQERITVNGETVRDRIEVKQSVIDTTGELTLLVQWKSGLMTVKSRLIIDEEVQPWTHYNQIKWNGLLGEWPDQFEYDANAGQ